MASGLPSAAYIDQRWFDLEIRASSHDLGIRRRYRRARRAGQHAPDRGGRCSARDRARPRFGRSARSTTCADIAAQQLVDARARNRRSRVRITSGPTGSTAVFALGRTSSGRASTADSAGDGGPTSISYRCAATRGTAACSSTSYGASTGSPTIGSHPSSNSPASTTCRPCDGPACSGSRSLRTGNSPSRTTWRVTTCSRSTHSSSSTHRCTRAGRVSGSATSSTTGTSRRRITEGRGSDLPHYPESHRRADTGRSLVPAIPIVWCRDLRRPAQRFLGHAARSRPLGRGDPRVPDRRRSSCRRPFRGAASATLQMWSDLNREDLDVLERLQRGRRSPAYDGGRLSPHWEGPTHRFGGMIVDAMLSDGLT